MPAFFNEQLNCFLLTQEDLRDIILGKVIYGQCLQCNGTGRENWNEDGEDVRPGHSDDPKTEQVEKFWVFAPKNTVHVATAFLKLVSHIASHQGYARIGLKEGLGFDSALFPKNKRTDGFDRDSYAMRKRRENTLDQIGWFDLDNCYYIFWDRGDIAQAFSNLHDFGNVLNLEVETYNLHEGFVGVTDAREYFKTVIDG